MTPYARIIDAVRNAVWAIQPEKLVVILDLLEFRVDGGRLSDSEIRARVDAAPAHNPSAAVRVGQARAGAVAIVPLVGTIIHRADAFTENNSGAISIERFRSSFRSAMNMAEVGSIVLDVDSPGGVIDGVPEMAAEILEARGKKKVVAIANTLAASAGYWIASAAEKLIVSPSGEVGSIGVWTAHSDMSKFYEQRGVKTTLISAGKFKTEGNPFGPLGDEARENIQSRVNDAYRDFVDAVASHRGVTAAAVRDNYGQGRVVGPKEALKAGMVDGIGTLDETVRAMIRPAAARATANRDFSFV